MGRRTTEAPRSVIVDHVIATHVARRRRRRLTVAGLTVAVVALFSLTLMVGNTFYGPRTVLRVVLGNDVPGAVFTVGELRLPRATLGLCCGLAFGAAGVTFQTMLRNPLASPDIIGISAGASAAAVVGIVVLAWSGAAVSLLALAGALVTALLMYVVGSRGGFSGSRLVLIGIALAALLRSVVSYVLTRAAAWDLQTAMRWLTGSVNGADWQRVRPVAVVTVAAIAILQLGDRELGLLRLGDESAVTLGADVRRARLTGLFAAVVLLAVATAAAGPIAFVAFMAGPIAARLVGPGASLLLPAALVGALLVLGADLVGQHAFSGRYPVGVVTGVIGAPYLVLLLVRTNRSGAAL